ncbi:MAG TPA: LexA family transcriptional regulator [Chloroflexota bacterium]|nr:LexA family transcriptional regulator [Chloroflexota bacterium]
MSVVTKEQALALGKRIAAERTTRAWTQPALAAQARVSKAYISKLESGKSRRPSQEQLDRVLAVLGYTNVDELLTPPEFNAPVFRRAVTPGEVRNARAVHERLAFAESLIEERLSEARTSLLKELAPNLLVLEEYRQMQAADRERKAPPNPANVRPAPKPRQKGLPPMLIFEAARIHMGEQGGGADGRTRPDIPSEWMDQASERYLAFEVTGDCMADKIHPGDWVVVDREGVPSPNKLIALTRVDTGDLIARVYVRRDGIAELHSRNDPPILWDADFLESEGVVVEVVRMGDQDWLS